MLHLISGEHKVTRNKKPNSFIIVLDNVLDGEEEVDHLKG